MSKKVSILLVEDNPGDVILAKYAFSKASMDVSISVAKDGEEALDYIFKKDDFSEVTTPDIVFLDINMPKKDGHDVLREMKEREDTKRIPVVMMTSSCAKRDVLKAYDLHVNSYIVKPTDLEQFVTTVSAIENFWFSIGITPKSVEEI